MPKAALLPRSSQIESKRPLSRHCGNASPGNSRDSRRIDADDTIGCASPIGFKRMRSVRGNPKDSLLVELRGRENVARQRFNCDSGPR